jgi:hypothetical protein
MPSTKQYPSGVGGPNTPSGLPIKKPSRFSK